MPKKTTIRVGQRLIRWDGEPGYVGLNSLGITHWEADQEFLVQWRDGESEYLTLKQFKAEGVSLGHGLMPWAR